MAPIGSEWWRISSAINNDLKEEIGWMDLAQNTAQIYQSLPAAEKPHAAILAGNYGEAGALNLYGKNHGLPRVISGVNSYYLRGFAKPPPETLIVVGYSERSVNQIFKSCVLAAQNTNGLNMENEESRDHKEIFVCREPRKPWAEIWKTFQSFS